MHENEVKKLEIEIMQREVDLDTLTSRRDQHRGAFSELCALMDRVAEKPEASPEHDPTAESDQ
jgi:hypothetical protein